MGQELARFDLDAPQVEIDGERHGRVLRCETISTSAAAHLPMGSGVVEAACKTLVSQRLQRSEMRWREADGQAILTFRALCQSERFDRAWPLLTATYRRSARLPHKVIDLHERRGESSVNMRATPMMV